MGIKNDFQIIANEKEILKMGVMSTPALMINGKIVISGRFPTIKEVKDIINKHI